MIGRREILDIAGTYGLRPQIVEKDYVLGWVLAGVYEQTALAESWIFKGGTCLKKCYFETYRFSEDLDFTLTDPSHVDRDFLAGVFRGVGEWIYERTGIEIPSELQEFEIFENPRGTVRDRADPARPGRHRANRDPTGGIGGGEPARTRDIGYSKTCGLGERAAVRLPTAGFGSRRAGSP